MNATRIFKLSLYYICTLFCLLQEACLFFAVPEYIRLRFCFPGCHFFIIHYVRCSGLLVFFYYSRRQHFKNVPCFDSQRRFGSVHGCLHHPFLPR